MTDELYSEIILDLYKNPLNHGHVQNFDIKSSGGNRYCGDEISIEMKVEKEMVKEIKFVGEGCAISKASASLVTEMAKGKTLAEVKNFSSEEVFEKLGGIIQTRVKCALLGLMVLKMGVEKFEENGKKKTETAKLRI
ncbi:MAG: Fe-S cluster assembly sulfur transfer protein SufU [archaeon]